MAVPRFEPFLGLRYSNPHLSHLEDLVCPPYDVISEPERLDLLSRSPYNVVRLELPRDGDDPYRAAAVLLDAWRDGDVLRRDHAPNFYGYEMSWKDDAGQHQATLGVIGALGLEEPGGGVLPHEQTTPKARSDRMALLSATRANLSPIWGLSLATGLSAALVPPEHAHEHARDAEGVVHKVWPIADPGPVEAIRRWVGSAPVLIADGHHRYETAMAYLRQRRAEGVAGPGDEAVMALVVELTEGQLTVQGIHRLISGLPAGFDVAEALSEAFEIMPTGPVSPNIGARMIEGEALAVVTPAGSFLARPRDPSAAGADLDSVRLDLALASLPPHELTYQHGWELAAAEVAAGSAQAAVLLRPARIDQIASTGKGGERMPPKTTFFWPKPRTGMVMRELVG
ncbi:MAG: DUF1015 family protein [Acidimicrobiales bacterium]